MRETTPCLGGSYPIDRGPSSADAYRSHGRSNATHAVPAWHADASDVLPGPRQTKFRNPASPPHSGLLRGFESNPSVPIPLHFDQLAARIS